MLMHRGSNTVTNMALHPQFSVNEQNFNTKRYWETHSASQVQQEFLQNYTVQCMIFIVNKSGIRGQCGFYGILLNCNFCQNYTCYIPEIFRNQRQLTTL